MALTGAWKRSPAAVGGETNRSHQPSDNWGEGVDPRHGTRDTQDPGFPAMVPIPFSPQLPPGLEDPYDPETQQGRMLTGFMGTGDDSTEPSGHDGIGTVPWGVTDQRRQQELNNAARSIDRGMAKAAVTRHVIGRDITETFDSQRTQSNEASKTDTPGPGQSQRALRGKNSLALNNPGSAEVNFSGNYTRAGYEQHRRTNRQFLRRGLTHTKRMLHLNLATVANPSAAPVGESYSPYTSPFDGRVTNLSPNRLSNMLRREPRPWDENTTRDAAGESIADDTSQYRSWGL